MATAINKEIQEFGGKSNIELLIAEVDRLISLPDVYYRLEALVEVPTSSMDDFARVLSSDPDLCARLLSLANSAFYSFPSTIESIDRAVQIIGVRQIRELVLATSVVNIFNDLPLGMVNMKMFWEHSVAVGVLAKAIGQYCRQPHTERYYVSGLLHDIGRLVLFLKLPQSMHDLLILRESKELPLHQLETEQLGYTHGEVGGELLKSWNIPPSIYEPVQFHHLPQMSLDESKVIAAVHIADAWINKNRIGSSGERFDVMADQSCMNELNLEPYEMDEIWVLAEDEIGEVYRQFIPQ